MEKDVAVFVFLTLLKDQPCVSTRSSKRPYLSAVCQLSNKPPAPPEPRRTSVPLLSHGPAAAASPRGASKAGRQALQAQSFEELKNTGEQWRLLQSPIGLNRKVKMTQQTF